MREWIEGLMDGGWMDIQVEEYMAEWVDGDR